MSSSRRSGRSRKQVDYSVTDKESPDNSDDDFQDSPSGPPPNKKPKTSTKTKPKPKQDERKIKERPTSSRKERLSLEEKMYKRELEAAIEASKKDSQSSEETNEVIQLSDDEQESEKTEKNKQSVKEIVDNTNKENEINQSPKGMSHEEVAASIGQEQEVDSKTPSSTEQEDNKSVSGEEEKNNDEEFNEDDDNDEESAVDDSDPNEQKERENNNKRKKGTAQPSPSKVGIKPRTSVTVTPIKMLKNQAKKKITGSSKESSIKSVSSAESGSASNSPQITISKPNVLTTSTNFLTSSSLRKSPGTGLGGVRIQSSGTLRLGLSRNVRVKPLLSKISVHQ